MSEQQQLRAWCEEGRDKCSVTSICLGPCPVEHLISCRKEVTECSPVRAVGDTGQGTSAPGQGQRTWTDWEMEPEGTGEIP